MSLVEMLILAVVQGITEFLPISSDGHLVIANALMEAWGAKPVKELSEVTIALHQGTLVAVLIYYRREILRLLSTDRRVLWLLVVGTIPAGIFGVFIKKVLPEETGDALLQNILLTGVCLPISGLLLWWSSRQREGNLDYQQLTAKQSLFIGVLQACAILPGWSRSGSTIAAGLFAGLRRETAATFAFLLGIPAILGAGVLEGWDIYKHGSSTPAGTLAFGFVVSMVVGYGALSLLIRLVERGRIAWFAYYLVPLGIAVIAWQLVK